MHVIVGLGNPGEEYEKTRHNVGRMALVHFASLHKLPEWEFEKKYNALLTEGMVTSGTGRAKCKAEVTLVLPETFMNKSGKAIAPLIKSKKKAERLVVVHDDMDLPRGIIKITFGRGAGGHHGVESIIRAVGTKDFTRVRIGVSDPAKKHGVKKPQGEKKVIDFLVKEMQKGDLSAYKKTMNVVSEALLTLVTEGRSQAMNKHN